MATRTVRLGATPVAFPSPQLQPITDSGPLLAAGDWPALRARLAEDGYLCLRGALPRAAVLAARARVLSHLEAVGGVLAPGRPASDGVLVNERCQAGCVPFMEGRNDVTHSPELLAVLEGRELAGLAAGVLGAPAAETFDFKWLRGGWADFYTGAHVDRVYMGRGSQRVLTTWVPLDDATLELGALAVLAGSHRLPGFARLQATYAELDVEADAFTGSGWYGDDPAELAAMDPGARWVGGDYAAGDVVLFGMRTLHMSTANATDRVRLSVDVRWQPAGDPRDGRYFGADVGTRVAERQKAGAWAAAAADGSNSGDGKEEAPKRTMAELRRLWGFDPPLPTTTSP
jgi:hypothetical protein